MGHARKNSVNANAQLGCRPLDSGLAGPSIVMISLKYFDLEHCDNRPVDMLLVNNALYSDQVD